MDDKVQAFLDKRAEKAAAKEVVMDNLGKALIADKRGEDSADNWKAVEEFGIHGGKEGQLQDEAHALAAAYVADNYDSMNVYLGTRTLEECVNLVEAFRTQGMTEDAARVNMWIEAKFEYQTIGGVAKVKVRPDWRGR